jgi:cytochrome b561
VQRYSKVIIALHWATAVLILAAWLTSEGGRQIRQNPPLLHFALGLSVLVLIVPRLLSRLLGGAPRIEDPRGPLMNLAAKVGHAVLYLFMIGLPITGWYAASRMGIPISIFGLSLPSIATAVQAPPGWVAELHEAAGTIILFLGGLHALIAVWHQFVLRDGTMQRMSPV